MSGLDGLVNSRQAADMLGLARADDAWRAVDRHANVYPGRVRIIQIGHAYAAHREDMQAFAEWYKDNVGRTTRIAKRREALRAAIGRIAAKQEER